MSDRPRGAKEFQRLVQRHAADVGQPPQRVMHLIRVGVVCAMLDGVRHDDGGHLFIVKGGTAMQLRLGIRARATTDLDVVFRGRLEAWLARFDEATADQTWNGFTVTRKDEPTEIDVGGASYKPWRVALQIRYEGREFGTTSFEVAIDEPTASHHDLVTADGIELASFDIDPPALVPCLNVPYQIAQKLHACTESVDGGNRRARDIVDIWMLEALVDAAELHDVRAAAVTTFNRRKKHAWPPAIEAAHFVPGDYEKLAAAYPDAPTTTEDATAYLNTLIAAIDNSGK
jgi:hypothetical protein